MIRKVQNPPNPYESKHYDWLEDPPEADIQVYHEVARSILSRNDSPDLSFTWSVNPYRGCQHGCAYCYARPYHEYLGYGAGSDFETRLVVKTNAAELLDAEFARPTWHAEPVMFSGITDCYQPLEAVYEMTRRCLEVCVRRRNPVGIVTRSYLIQRDAELLVELDHAAGAFVFMSLPFADDRLARKVEPFAPPPTKRFEAMNALSLAGVPVGVFIAPIIPGLNESEIPTILGRAADAGATMASHIALRLPRPVDQVFMERLRATMPDRVNRIENRIRDIRGGRLNSAQFGQRMKGEGPYWDSVRRLFQVAARKAGLATDFRMKRGPASTSNPPNQLAFEFDSHESS